MKTIISLLFIFFLFTVTPAATFTVTNTAESGAGSLRQAIADANAASGDDVIAFQSGLSGTITLTGGELLINSNIAINGSGADVISISGNASTRIFNIAANSTVNINNLTVTNGRLSSITQGGGIYSAGTLDISNLRVINGTDGTSFGGDGVGVYNSGTMTILNSTIANNRFAPRMGPVFRGGGIYNAGTMTIERSTVSSNLARTGGGIYNAGNLTVRNSTIHGNSTRAAGADGAGILEAGSSLVLSNATVAKNIASGMSNGVCGGISIRSTSSVNLYNSIVADNTRVSANIDPCDVQGTVTSLGNNLIGNSFESSGWLASDKLNQPALLMDLMNNGGPTSTAALSSSSPAVNGGNNANAPSTDQRGFARIVGEIIDIGAYESEFVPTAAPVLITGRVSDAAGRSIHRAQIILTDEYGTQRITQTNAFGFYRFDAPAGHYVLTVRHKRFNFTPRVFFADGREDIDFIGG